MDRRFHQSIKKHLPRTQHDLYLVNRIVSLYPYIIIVLIPLAVCLIFFKANLQEHRDRRRNQYNSVQDIEPHF